MDIEVLTSGVIQDYIVSAEGQGQFPTGIILTSPTGTLQTGLAAMDM